MGETKTYVFPENGNSNNGIDPALLVALTQNGGGFGNGAMWMWPLFMFMMYPWLFGSMGNGFGGFGGWGNAGAANALGVGYLSNQLSNDSNVNTLLQALNGRADCISQLANILNTNVGNVQNGINALQMAIQQTSNLVGLTGQQVINSIQNGNAALSQQLCQCCCDNRFAVCQLGNELGRQADNHFSSLQYQIGQNHSEGRLDVCQQTNELKTQGIANTQALKDQINQQSIMINEKFCDLEKRELQDKITGLTADNALLRSQLDNGEQTRNILGQVGAYLAPLQAKVNEIAAKQPNTVPVQYPNVQAVDATPCCNRNNQGCGCNGNNFNPYGPYAFGPYGPWMQQTSFWN